MTKIYIYLKTKYYDSSFCFVHCEEECDFSSQEREAYFLVSVAKRSTKLSMIFSDKKRQKVLLSRAVVGDPKSMNDMAKNRFNPYQIWA